MTNNSILQDAIGTCVKLYAFSSIGVALLVAYLKDELFKRLETIDTNSLALKQYKIYKQAAGDICSK